MRVQHWLLWLGMVALVGGACGAGTEEGGSLVTVRIVEQQLSSAGGFSVQSIPSDVAYLVIDVTGAGMQPLHQRVDITAAMREQGFVSIGLTVPNGPERFVSVEAFDSGGESVYFGHAESPIDLSGAPVEVVIFMFPR